MVQPIQDTPMSDKEALQWEKLREKSDFQLQVMGPFNVGLFFGTLLSIAVIFLWNWLAPASWPLSIRWWLIVVMFVVIQALAWWTGRNIREMQERRYLLWLEAKEAELAADDENGVYP